MQGASALESVLKEQAGPDIRVYVVWERILATDYAAPGSGVLARVSDPRAVQYWDPDLLLSKMAQPVLAADPARVVGKKSLVTGKYVWDYEAIYPPGVTWDAAFPLPELQGAPVADVAKDLMERYWNSRSKSARVRR
ncbi:MAG: hypothetical protein ABI693_19535 [Bryobacteraceae bacterium]